MFPMGADGPLPKPSAYVKNACFFLALSPKCGIKTAIFAPHTGISPIGKQKPYGFQRISRSEEMQQSDIAIKKEFIDIAADLHIPTNEGKPILFIPIANKIKRTQLFFQLGNLFCGKGLLFAVRRGSVNGGYIAIARSVRAIHASKAVMIGNGRTSLHEATFRLNTEIVEALIDARADVNARDNGGKTPLHCAGNAKIAAVRIRSGADANARDNDGNLPPQRDSEQLG